MAVGGMDVAYSRRNDCDKSVNIGLGVHLEYSVVKLSPAVLKDDFEYQYSANFSFEFHVDALRQCFDVTVEKSNSGQRPGL